MIFDVVLFYFYVKFYQSGCLQNKINKNIPKTTNLHLRVYGAKNIRGKLTKNIPIFFVEKIHLETHVKIASCLTGFTKKKLLYLYFVGSTCVTVRPGLQAKCPGI